MLEIQEHTQVRLHFAIRINETEEVESTFDQEPVMFTIGDGNLLESFEKAIFGLTAGDHEIIRIDSEEAFGEYNKNNMQKIPASEFKDLTISTGLVLMFANQAKFEVPGVVTDYDNQWVHIDFNHPLAGRDIWFEVKIIEVSPKLT